jgi:hypothetical protein
MLKKIIDIHTEKHKKPISTKCGVTGYGSR